MYRDIYTYVHIIGIRTTMYSTKILNPSAVGYFTLSLSIKLDAVLRARKVD